MDWSEVLRNKKKAVLDGVHPGRLFLFKLLLTKTK
ncbi:hypothetical protein HNO89_003908 [Sporosarcina luteola]|nr:hypothetical protein [Sporosarcina luteola]